MTRLAERLSSLTPKQRQALELELRKKGVQLGKFQIPPRSAEREAYPLSWPQQRLWFVEQLVPDSGAYHILSSLAVDGALDVEALDRALQALVARHEALRTTFGLDPRGQPVQRVAARRRQPLPVLDLGGLEEIASQDEQARLGAEHSRRPFDLGRGPLLRITLMRRAPESHTFLLAQHHLISDGWSMGIFTRELMACYEAFAAGREPVLPELPIQYPDYALWQREAADGEAQERQLAYWRERLEGAPPLLELPLDRPRPPLPRLRGALAALPLEAETGEALRAVARSGGQTLFVVLLACFNALLARISGQADVVVGTPIANRHREEVENVLGFFANTLVLRSAVGRGDSFRDLAARLWKVNAEANRNQDLPFERLVEELEVERSLRYNPLFQAVFLLFDRSVRGGRPQEAPARAPGSLSVRPAAAGGVSTSPFDLLLAVTDTGAGLEVGLQYNSDLFDRTTALRLLRAFRRMAAALAADPDARPAAVDLLGPAGRQQVAVEWPSRRELPLPAPALHRLFERWAAETPKRVALVAEGESLSYGDLDRWAGVLARRLVEAGAGPETLVGLHAERSAALVAGLLAILKAGAAYLPLDPAYPRERLAFTAGDAGVAAVLSTDPAGAAEVFGEAESPPPVVALGASPGDAEEGAEAGLRPAIQPEVRPENRAYTIYTSGSTGQPKGVEVTHGNVLRLLAATEARFCFGPDDVWSLFHSYAFDFSVWEVWGALAHGGRLVVVPREVSRAPKDFLRLLAAEGVTVLNQTPSAFRQLVAADAAEGEPTRDGDLALRWVVFGGEPLEVASLRPWIERHGDSAPRLVNMFGITETTVHVTEKVLESADLDRPLPGSPIGRALPDLSAQLLDRALQPVPPGVVGEIFVGGAGAARGYLGRPALTAWRFLPDPAAPEAGARMYRSGDLARALPKGELVHLGRADQQVQLRGFRIELGEVEAALGEHPALASVAVVDRAGPGGEVLLAAYLVWKGEAEAPEVGALRTFAAERLPEHMVPGAFVPLDALPLTANGKLDRWALPDPTAGRLRSAASAAPRGALEKTIAAVWQEVLEIEKVGADESFFDLGGHSLLLVRVQQRLREELEREVPMIDLFRFPTVGLLARALEPSEAPAARLERAAARAAARQESGRERGTAIAVVGMAGRFPGAPDLERFWTNLREGVESVTFYSDEELLAEGIPAEALANPHYVKAESRLEEAELFDAALFGMSPREAQLIDPQQRLFLECAWQALEDAGYDPETYPGAIGLFAGADLSGYWMNLLSNAEVMESFGALTALIGNDKDFLPTRVSYKLNLRGPSINVQTACSTALVGAHLACQSLLSGECDLAMAGGVSATIGGKRGYIFQPEGISSPDGHCRAFDARAEGTVGGNGVGAVVLKRLDRALADGDHVHAVIRGSALNNDGSLKIGFTAPSVDGQANVIAEAQAVAGVGAETVSYVEAHGTATRLGDPIEAAALNEVFGQVPGASCALGSVKTNIGHAGAAAGAAGLLKTVLALEHGEIPPSLHCREPNPEIDWSRGLRVATALEAWPRPKDHPRRAGVSSFGLGGTNAHMVLEEAPEPEASGPSRPWQLLVLSAQTESALEALGARLAGYLAEHPGAPLPDVSYTLQTGRRRLRHRRAVVCRDAAEAGKLLAGEEPQRVLSGAEERKQRPVAFLLPGVGDQHTGLAADLYREEPVFREVLDRAAAVLEPLVGADLRELLYPEEAGPEGGNHGAKPDLRRMLGRGDQPAEEKPLERTRVAQPLVFAVEVALARLWTSWGIEPEALLGYSLGEYAAAHLAGSLGFEDALRLVAERARLIDALPAGAMLAVSLPGADLEPILSEERFADRLAVAAINAPAVTVVAGAEAAVAALEQELTRREVVSRRIAAGHAFHTPMMLPAVERFEEVLATVELRPPEIPWISNSTGTWITAEEAVDPGYWTRHLCRKVHFSEGIETLLEGSERILLEVGPGQALSTSARQHPARTDAHSILASLPDRWAEVEDQEHLLGVLGRLWLAGASVDWGAFSAGERRHRLPLPTYPFERRRYFIEGPRASSAPVRRSDQAKLPDPADWFHVPGWRRTPPPLPPTAEDLEAAPGPWLVLTDEAGLGAELAAALRRAGQDVLEVAAGAAFGDLPEGAKETSIDPRRAEDDFAALCEALAPAGRLPRTVVHLWSLTEEAAERLDFEAFEEQQARGFGSLLALARALAHLGHAEPLQLAVIANRFHPAGEGCAVEAGKATLRGSLKVLPQEYRNVLSRTFDVALPAQGSGREGLRRLAERLLAELVPALAPNAPAADLAVAYRGREPTVERFVEAFEPLPLPPPKEHLPGLVPGGAYLVTGGFGQVGGTLARYLAARVGARLALVGRSELPPRQEWNGVLAGSPEGDPGRRRVELVRALEEAGAEVLPLAADVTDTEAVRSAVETAVERFGGLDGVFHLAGSMAGETLYATLEQTTPGICAAQLGPKARGAVNLEEALLDSLGEKPPALCVLFSSLSTVLGGLGFSAYAAGNAFLDAFARDERRGLPWLSLDWDSWRATEEIPETGSALSMSPAESCDALHRLLAMAGSPRVVVSLADLDARLDRWVRFAGQSEAAEASASGGTEAGERFERPDLRNPYVEPETETQHTIAEIWQELLGLERVGLHDNFYELGGDSLLATQVVSRMRRLLQVELPLAAFFRTPTVAGVAEASEQTEYQQGDLSAIEDMLARVRGMSQDEVEEALGEPS